MSALSPSDFISVFEVVIFLGKHLSIFRFRNREAIMSRAILVTGATGRQGGGLIKTLLASPDATSIRIFALSRNQQSPAAVKLKEQGVAIIQGDLNNVPAIFEDAQLLSQSLWGVFSVQVRLSSLVTA